MARFIFINLNFKTPDLSEVERKVLNAIISEVVDHDNYIKHQEKEHFYYNIALVHIFEKSNIRVRKVLDFILNILEQKNYIIHEAKTVYIEAFEHQEIAAIPIFITAKTFKLVFSSN